MITSFCREVVENCALLVYYVASIGNSLNTFRDRLPVPSSRVKNPGVLLTIRNDLPVPYSSNPLKMGPSVCPETSVRNYHYSPRNSPQQHSTQMAHFVAFAFAE